jgi:GH15 family glucan-1,4-alpha-glucosidase
VDRCAARSGALGLSGGEGVFLPCSFWLADNYVLQGRQHEAEGLCARLGLEVDSMHVRLDRH